MVEKYEGSFCFTSLLIKSSFCKYLSKLTLKILCDLKILFAYLYYQKRSFEYKTQSLSLILFFDHNIIISSSQQNSLQMATEKVQQLNGNPEASKGVGKVRICVIGAGPSGLMTLRALQSLDVNKFEIICYERHSEIGGIWNFRLDK